MDWKPQVTYMHTNTYINRTIQFVVSASWDTIWYELELFGLSQCIMCRSRSIITSHYHSSHPSFYTVVSWLKPFAFTSIFTIISWIIAIFQWMNGHIELHGYVSFLIIRVGNKCRDSKWVSEVVITHTFIRINVIPSPYRPWHTRIPQIIYDKKTTILF